MRISAHLPTLPAPQDKAGKRQKHFNAGLMLLEPSRSEYLRLTRAWVSGAFAAGPWAADAADITDQDLLVEALPGYHQMDVCDNYRGAHRPYHRACKAPGPARHNRMFAAGALGVVQRVAGSPCGDGRLRHALARSVGTNGSAALCSPPCGGPAASPVPPRRVACDIRVGDDACLLPRQVTVNRGRGWRRLRPDEHGALSRARAPGLKLAGVE